MNHEKIKNIMLEMGKTQFGAALRLFLDDEEVKLRHIEDCKSFAEVEGRKFALGVISNIRKSIEGTPVASKSRTDYN